MTGTETRGRPIQALSIAQALAVVPAVSHANQDLASAHNFPPPPACYYLFWKQAGGYLQGYRLIMANGYVTPVPGW